MLRDARQRVLLPAMRDADERAAQARAPLRRRADARAHARPAGDADDARQGDRELRLSACSGRPSCSRPSRIHGKFNGAVGNHNAHVAAYPDADWLAITDRFLGSLGLTHDALHDADRAARLDRGVLPGAVARSTRCSIDLCRDFWSYISLGYFRSRPVAGEVGSSTMPHKVNPIDFENAEGNLGLANELLGVPRGEAADLALAARPHRLDGAAQRRRRARPHADRARGGRQRAWASSTPTSPTIAADLADRWEVLAEAVQTVMRRYGLPDAYEQLKELTRGRAIDAEDAARVHRRAADPGRGASSGCSRSTPPLIRASPPSSRAASRLAAASGSRRAKP